MKNTCVICGGHLPRGTEHSHPRKYCGRRCYRVAQSRDQHQRRQSVNYARGEDMGLRGRQLDLTSPPRIMNEPTARQRAAMEADGVDPASFGRW